MMFVSITSPSCLVLTALGAGLSLASRFGWFVLGLLLTAYLILFILGVSVLKLNFFVSATCRARFQPQSVSR